MMSMMLNIMNFIVGVSVFIFIFGIKFLIFHLFLFLLPIIIFTYKLLDFMIFNLIFINYYFMFSSNNNFTFYYILGNFKSFWYICIILFLFYIIILYLGNDKSNVLYNGSFISDIGGFNIVISMGNYLFSINNLNVLLISCYLVPLLMLYFIWFMHSEELFMFCNPKEVKFMGLLFYQWGFYAYNFFDSLIYYFMLDLFNLSYFSYFYCFYVCFFDFIFPFIMNSSNSLFFGSEEGWSFFMFFFNYIFVIIVFDFFILDFMELDSNVKNLYFCNILESYYFFNSVTEKGEGVLSEVVGKPMLMPVKEKEEVKVSIFYSAYNWVAGTFIWCVEGVKSLLGMMESKKKIEKEKLDGDVKSNRVWEEGEGFVILDAYNSYYNLSISGVVESKSFDTDLLKYYYFGKGIYFNNLSWLNLFYVFYVLMVCFTSINEDYYISLKLNFGGVDISFFLKENKLNNFNYSSFNFINYKVINNNSLLEFPLFYYPISSTPHMLFLYSSDVIHSLGIPSLFSKLDVFPNFVNIFMFYSSNKDFIDFYCTEFCGVSHSFMKGKLIFLSYFEVFIICKYLGSGMPPATWHPYLNSKKPKSYSFLKNINSPYSISFIKSKKYNYQRLFKYNPVIFISSFYFKPMFFYFNSFKNINNYCKSSYFKSFSSTSFYFYSFLQGYYNQSFISSIYFNNGFYKLFNRLFIDTSYCSSIFEGVSIVKKDVDFNYYSDLENDINFYFSNEIKKGKSKKVFNIKLLFKLLFFSSLNFDKMMWKISSSGGVDKSNNKFYSVNKIKDMNFLSNEFYKDLSS